MDIEKLIGLEAKSVKVSDDKEEIEIALKDGRIATLKAWGDCCSNSWFEHIENIDVLIGNEIVGVIEREMPDGRQADDCEWVEFYGWSIQTQKGSCDIEMRNMSNGYYGGNVELCFKGEEQNVNR